MSDAVTSSLGIVAYLALFATVGIVFLLATLVIGRFVRPQNPHSEKLETYECGEPAVGTSFVQFDLRFYVVALLFIIFDVEVAFFFPWATVFGKATHLSDRRSEYPIVTQVDGATQLTRQTKALYQELGVREPTVPREVPASLRDRISATTPDAQRAADVVRHGARQLALVTVIDIAVFFAVLLVGFAYVWNRGDLNWVRAYTRRDAAGSRPDAERETLDLDQALSA
jgi:NADH-quinone oxidoreductase subunit A